MVHNEDSQAHTVSADTGSAFNVMVPASSTVSLTAPAKAGSYKFHCDYHSNMHGTLTVG
jgi:plastocyanin